MDSDYAQFHRNRANLLLHIVAVPLFVFGAVAAVWLAAMSRFGPAVAFAALPVISLAIQGRGHRLEPTPPRPFTGPGNFLGRILAEQFFRFPRFVVSGGWAKAMRESPEE